jgi:hypothetical protein
LKESLLGRKVLKELLPRRPRRNLVIILLTVGEDGYPNVCLLSPFQVVAKDKQTIYLAVYEGSKTLANLEKCRNATLVLFIPPAAYYIKGEVKRLHQPRMSFVQGNIYHRLNVKRVIRDYYRRAPIMSTVTFEQENVLSDYSRVYQSLIETAQATA